MLTPKSFIHSSTTQANFELPLDETINSDNIDSESASQFSSAAATADIPNIPNSDNNESDDKASSNTSADNAELSNMIEEIDDVEDNINSTNEDALIHASTLPTSSQTNTDSNDIEAEDNVASSKRTKQAINPPDYCCNSQCANDNISPAAAAVLCEINNLNSPPSSQSVNDLTQLEDDSDYENEPSGSLFSQPLKNPSNVSQLGKFWYRNPNNIPFPPDNLPVKVNHFRNKLSVASGGKPKVEQIVESDFENYSCTWEENEITMAKIDFESSKEIVRIFNQHIATERKNPRRFRMNPKIAFSGNDEKGQDCGGLRIEALERHNNDWLLDMVEKHPDLFVKKNDSYASIDHIPKTNLEKKLVRRFIVNSVFGIPHTARLPTYGDPVLLASIFNHSDKSDDVFYTHYLTPYDYLENDEMRLYCTSVKGKKCTGVLAENADPDSNPGGRHFSQHLKT